VQNFYGDLQISKERDFISNYLVLSLTNTQKVIPYQLELIKQNAYPGIIPLAERMSNNQTQLYYRLNSAVSFLQYLEREETELAEILQILDSIVSILLESKNLLLYASGFLLEEEYIYLEPHTGEVSLLYVPVKLAGDVNENFRNLIRRVLFYRGDLPQNIINYCEDNNFKISGFREQLKEIKYPLLKKEKQNKEKEKPFQLASPAFLSQEEELGEVQRGETPTEETGSKGVRRKEVQERQERPERPRREGIQVKGQQGQGKAVVKKENLRFPKKTISAFLLVQLVLVVVLLLLSPWLNSLEDSSATYGGIILILVALNLLFFRRLTKHK